MSDPDPADRLRQLLDRVAPFVDQGEAALERRKRFQAQADEELTRLLQDQGEPREVRSTALAVLVDRHRKGSALAGIVLELFDDPDEELARLAIRSSPPFDQALTDRLRGFLEDPREGLRAEAALTLARRKDPKLLRRISPWLLGGDPPRTRLALTCLDWLLSVEDRITLLERALRKGPEEPWRLDLLTEALDRLAEEDDPT